MNDNPDAELQVNLEELRRAFEFVMKSSRSSRARLHAAFDGNDLILTKARSSAKVTAVGRWPGTVTFPGRDLLRKLAHVGTDGGQVTLTVVGGRLRIGDFVVDCD